MKRKDFIINTGLITAGIGLAPTGVYSNFFKNNRIKLGVIGTGSRGNGLGLVIKNIEGLEVIACCDILPFRLERALEISKKAKAYNDYRKLLEDKDIDAVIISTPFNTHHQIALEAIETGKHIYCEKTMAKGYKAIKDLVDKSKDNKNIFQTGHQYHSSRLYVHVVDLIKKGEIGKVVAIESQWNRNADWRRPVKDKKYEKNINWRMYKEFSGGLLAELCSHQIDFCNWILNSTPVKVMGDGGIDYWKDGRETYDNVHMIYTYPNGVRAKFTCLTSNAKDDYKIRVFGDKGTIILDYTKAWIYPEKSYKKKYGEMDAVSGATINWEQNQGIPIKKEHMDPSKQALVDFRDSIINNTPAKSDVFTGAKSAICVQMGLDALYNNQIVKWKEGIL